MSLPPISEQTQLKLKHQGYINNLYQNLKINQIFKPRTLAHQFYTGFIMTASGIGYLIAKRGGYLAWPLGFAFLSAPVLALYQKRDLDFYDNTATSIVHPRQLAQEFPNLFREYNKVLVQVQDEILRQKQVLRGLESERQE